MTRAGFVIVFIITMLVNIGIIYGKYQKSFLHPDKMACNECHLAQNEITDENAHQLIASQEKLCANCHKLELEISHPSGLVPQGKLPGEFLLDWKGEMTCSTCHNIHNQHTGSLKVQASGKNFCLMCHEESFFTTMADKGTSIQDGVHMSRIKSNNFSVADPYSIHCMSCHGEEGDTVDVFINSRGIVKHASGSANHPVGMLYSDAVKRGGYRKIFELSSHIQLPDGKVSCISCHQPYNKNHGVLIKNKSYTGLCMECHDM